MDIKLINTTAENVEGKKICGYNSMKQVGYVRKLQWLKEQYKVGLKHRLLVTEEQGGVGGIEYVPGEYAWRPVNAEDYLFIHCLYIVKKDIKGKGYGEMLIQAAIDDAKDQKKAGVAVIARKSTWMAGSEVFAKCGFKTVAKAKPDFELMVYQIDKAVELPSFKEGWNEKLKKKHSDGLTIYTSDQCPYLAKCNTEIDDLLENDLNIEHKMIHLKSHSEAQEVPCAFGVCCIINNGKIVSDKPASKTRFQNILKKEGLV